MSTYKILFIIFIMSSPLCYASHNVSFETTTPGKNAPPDWSALHHLAEVASMIDQAKCFTCKVCKQSFCQRYRLIQHGCMHVKQTMNITKLPFSCSYPKCSFEAWRKESVKKHLQNTHNMSRKKALGRIKTDYRLLMELHRLSAERCL